MAKLLPLLHSQETEEDSNFEATPSCPPFKKRKVATSSRKGMKKISPDEIAHYAGNQRQTVVATTKLYLKEAAAELVSEDSDIAITKEMRNTARTMKQMAQLAKRRPGLRSTAA